MFQFHCTSCSRGLFSGTSQHLQADSALACALQLERLMEEQFQTLEDFRRDLRYRAPHDDHLPVSQKLVRSHPFWSYPFDSPVPLQGV